jgi:Na+/proline symporter
LTTSSAIYESGISFGINNIIWYVFGAILLGIIAKKIFETGEKYQIYSIVDFFKKRFDRKNEVLVLIVQLLLLVTWAATQIIGITYLISILVDIDYYLALGISTGITILYTAIGGLKIDIITDFLQFRIIFLVFIIMAFFGYQHIGSINNLIHNLPSGHLNIFNF